MNFETLNNNLSIAKSEVTISEYNLSTLISKIEKEINFLFSDLKMTCEISSDSHFIKIQSKTKSKTKSKPKSKSCSFVIEKNKIYSDTENGDISHTIKVYEKINTIRINTFFQYIDEITRLKDIIFNKKINYYEANDAMNRYINKDISGFVNKTLRAADKGPIYVTESIRLNKTSKRYFLQDKEYNYKDLVEDLVTLIISKLSLIEYTGEYEKDLKNYIMSSAHKIKDIPFAMYFESDTKQLSLLNVL